MSNQRDDRSSELSEERLAEKLGQPSSEVLREFAEAAHLGDGGNDVLAAKLQKHNESSPKLSGGDVDAAWEDSASGNELVGGDNPTPDQDVVDELGGAMGIHYADGEELHTAEKIHERDEHRWELDPASSEGFAERSKEAGGEEK